MIRNDAPQNTALLSNVGAVGEFRIRNSAKAFNILSSGLYANKIRAVIRELSCNAVDSHVAHGCTATPFDLHLPTQLEPWFAIRDYGTGLSHQQVTDIYTTYFESTKTDSNAYIGALGLGSKSPFSYTDNFSVTAVKAGHKGIYTAYINDQGVPSIALMLQEPTDEPSGVEIRFAVNNSSDFYKFRTEAASCLAHFAVKPVCNITEFRVEKIKYDSKNIIPGVHRVASGTKASMAVMGNIAYPIAVPNAEQTLGDLRNLLACGLELHFAIGELDFQASREGLSYDPQTIAAIRSKLEAVNAALTGVLTKELDAVDCMWSRALLISSKMSDLLWAGSADKYVKDTAFPLIDQSGNNYNYNRIKRFESSVDNLATKYNIAISAFRKSRADLAAQNIKPDAVRVADATSSTGYKTSHTWSFAASTDLFFVEVDTRRGSLQRAKFHWKENKDDLPSSSSVFLIAAADKTKPVKFAAFMAALYEPPVSQRIKASQLLEKPKADSQSWGNASVLVLEQRMIGRRTSELVWTSAGTASSLDPAKTYYYVAMEGWNAVGTPIGHNIKDLSEVISRAGICQHKIYGVRRKDIDLVKTQKNWVELNEYVRGKLAGINLSNVMGMVKEAIDFKSYFKYFDESVGQASPYRKFYEQFKGVDNMDQWIRQNLQNLFAIYGVPVVNVDPAAMIRKYQTEIDGIKDRYPLLRHLSNYGVDNRAVAEYINLVDAK